MKRDVPIDGDTRIEELLEQYPVLAGVFVRHGLPCFVCGEPAWGTIGDLCKQHGHDLSEVLSVLRAAAGKSGKPADKDR
jgi:hypothetical protein